MYAYIDETGNTGQNLFDPEQPVFMTAALITKSNFDLLYNHKIKAIAQQIDVEVLHANELGLHKLEKIASDLLSVFKKSNSRIYVARVVKIDLAATKLVDTIFDSGENLAVPWHSYNLRPLRLLLVLKVAYLLDEETIKLFWNCLMDKNKEKAYIKFRELLTKLLSKVNTLPDARSRELISEALCWAMDNPEAIKLYTGTRAFKYGHLPNIVVFPQLLGGIEKKSLQWDRPVREIVHDRQSQFGSILKSWHELCSNAPKGSLQLFGGEKVEFRRVSGSKLIISSAEHSVGIQVIDIILWLFKKIHDSEALPTDCANFMSYVLRMGGMYDLSLKSISEGLSDFMNRLEEAPVSDEQIKKAHELLQAAEKGRQGKLRSYYEKKILTKGTD